MITERELNAMKICAPLLPEPGNEVVQELIEEVMRLRAGVNDAIDKWGTGSDDTKYIFYSLQALIKD
jgi:hypothetical protein